MRRFFLKKAQLLRHPRHNPFDYVVILSAQATLFPDLVSISYDFLACLVNRYLN